MAKYVAAGIAGSLVLGGLYARNRQPAETRASSAAYELDAPRFARESRFTSKTSTTVITGESEKTRKMREQIEFDHQRAIQAQTAAQDYAAKAAAAVAASGMLREKEEEAMRRSEAELRTVEDLERAASAKRNEAREAAKLASKDRKYFKEAEYEANKLLKSQEKAMAEAAQYEERARDLERVMRTEEEKLIIARHDEAERMARAAQAAKQVEAERMAQEKAAADEARRLAEDEKTRFRLRQEALNSSSRSAVEAAERQRAAELALEQARRSYEKAQLERSSAEKTTRDLKGNLGDFDKRMEAVVGEVRRHEAAAADAAAAIRRAEADELAARQAQAESVSMSQQFKSWWSGNRTEGSTITAVAQATGKAVATPVYDRDRVRGTHEGVHVDSVGQAKVTLVETARPVYGGKDNAAIDVASSRGGAVSEVKMAESSKDVKSPRWW